MSSDRIAFAGTVTAEGRRIKGSVLIKDQRTYRNGEYVMVDPAALIKADMSSAFASMEHDDAKLLGVTANGTLTINRTEQGFDYEIDNLPNTSYANDALELVRGGYVTGSSFEIDGLHSKFEVDPVDGKRIRIYDRIERFASVSPVRDPAFPSMAAAFKKETSEMSEAVQPVETPAPPAPVAAPVAQFTETPKGDSWAPLAKRLSTEQIEGQMESMFAQAQGNLTGDMLDGYEAFANELDERKKTDADAKARAERMAQFHALRMGRVPKAPQSSEMFASEDYNQAFSKYLRDGRPAHMEQFAQSIAGDGTQGGFTVPDGFLNRITERLKAFGGIAKHAEELTTTTGESLRWGSNDDTSNTSAIAAEGAAGTAGADLEFGSIELGAFSYDSNGTGNVPLKVSLELIQDSAFDIASLVERKLSQRIGRKQASHFATGMGGTEPFGLLSKTADAMTATVVSMALPEHVLQADSEYRDQGNCRWILSDTSLLKIWQSQDTTNRPMIVPGEGLDGKPAQMLWGYPYQIDPAAGDLVAFGDIKLGYVVRRVRGIQLLVDPYTAQSTRQVAYHAWARADANVNDSYAVSVSTWSGVSADT